LSLSFWWDTKETRIFDGIFTHCNHHNVEFYFGIVLELFSFPLPFEAHWTEAMTETAAIVYLSILIHETAAQLDGHRWSFEEDAMIPTTAESGLLQEIIACAQHRYLEDFCVLLEPSFIGNYNTTMITQNVTLLHKFQSYAQRTARYLIEEMMVSTTHDVNVERDVLQLTANEKQNLSYLLASQRRKGIIDQEEVDVASTSLLSVDTQQHALQQANQRSILVLKLLDYVEEIFMFFPSSSHQETAATPYRAQVSTEFVIISHTILMLVINDAGDFDGRIVSQTASCTPTTI
jgi:hypothetical protein